MDPIRPLEPTFYCAYIVHTATCRLRMVGLSQWFDAATSTGRLAVE